jgi:hypothetical protein
VRRGGFSLFAQRLEPVVAALAPSAPLALVNSITFTRI